jgi:hypothetical protein
MHNHTLHTPCAMLCPCSLSQGEHPPLRPKRERRVLQSLFSLSRNTCESDQNDERSINTRESFLIKEALSLVWVKPECCLNSALSPKYLCKCKEQMWNVFIEQDGHGMFSWSRFTVTFSWSRNVFIITFHGHVFMVTEGFH